MQILEVIRLTRQGFSQREIARSVNCVRNTVAGIQQKFDALGRDYEDLCPLTEAELKRLFYPRSASPGRKPDPDWESISERLGKNPRLNLQYVWEEYHALQPDGLKYSQFCVRYRAWRQQSGKDVVMSAARRPGHELFVDWAGDTLDCVTDASTGELHRAYFFVATLGDSGYPFAKAYADMRQASWLDAHASAFAYYGGAPRIVTPDNTKTAATHPSYYDPKVNVAYAELARHYGVAVLPARVSRPRDKPSVESGVGWLETWLLEHLKSCGPYLSFAGLNGEIASRLAALAVRPYQKRAGSRRSVFEELDRPALRPLPARAFEVAETVVRRVPNSYHVAYDHICYSVPYTLFGAKVFVKAAPCTVEVLDASHKRVALHVRSYDALRHRYVTDPAHMPAHHKEMFDRSRQDGDWYRCRARRVGGPVEEVVGVMLGRPDFEEAAYRSCAAVLALSKTYSDAVLERACAHALDAKSVSYRSVKELCAREKRQGHKAGITHENLRLPAEFS